MKWLEILRTACEAKGRKAVAADLGVPVGSLNAALAPNGNPEQQKALPKRVLDVLGGGAVQCPVLGEIESNVCGRHKSFAAKLGNRAPSNPNTLRLVTQCRRCLSGA